MIYVYLAAALALFSAGWGVEAYRWSAHDKAVENAKLNETVKTVESNDKEVVKYVDRIVEVQSKPVTVVRTRLVDRVCPGNSSGVPSQPSADAARAAADGDRVAGELKRCLVIWHKLNSIQNEVEPQLPKP